MTKRKQTSDINPKFANRNPERISEFQALYDSGLTDREIAKLTSVHHNTVAAFRRNHNLKPNGSLRRKIELVGSDHAKCSRCGQVQPLSNWPVARDGKKYPYRLSYCRDCRRKQMYETQNRSLESIFRDRLNRVRNRSKGKFDLTLEYLMSLYHNQSGKCFYSDITMEINKGSGAKPNSLSIDKIDPSLGYVRGNVVLCAYRINSIKRDTTPEEMRKWMPGWYRRIKELFPYQEPSNAASVHI